MKDLELLDLSGTSVGDGAIEHLTGLANLRNLDVRRTRFSDAGLRLLKESLPSCDIRH
jgi:hypothetical protein